MLFLSHSKVVCHAACSCLHDRLLLSKTFASIKRTAWLLPVLILLLCGNSYSQTAYRTMNGYVLATGNYNDSVFFAESHKLAIVYDQSDKTIYGQINLQTSTSGIPFIDSILSAKNRLITFNGYIPVDFLTWDHLEYNLDIPLIIEFNNIKINYLSKMKFSHVDKLLNYTCILEASFNLKLSDFDINVPEAVGSDISVQFLQLILRRGRR